MPPDLITALLPPAGAMPPDSPALTGSTPGAALFASLLAGTVPPPTALLPSPAAVPLSFAATGPAKIGPVPIGTASAGIEAGPAGSAAPTPRKLTAGDVPPPLLPLPTALSQAALPPADPAEKGSVLEDSPPTNAKTHGAKLKDSQKEDTKDPVDTPSAPVLTGELFLPPPPPLVSAVLQALPAATPLPAVPSLNAPATPRISEAVVAQPETMAATMTTPAGASVSWTPPVDVPVTATPTAAVPAVAMPVANATVPNAAVAIPGFALPTGAVPVATAPDKNSASKTPQKDLKTGAVRADTYTRTQTELPRIIHLTRTELRTEAAPTDGHSTDGLHTDERRMDAGQGKAALPAATLLLSTGTAAAAVPEAKATEIKMLTPTEKLEVVQQLADGAGGMRLSAAGTAQEMTVQLHPKDWGSLHVTVQIAPGTQTQTARGDALTTDTPKRITAQIVAETPQIKAALESHTGDLHQKLREAGLHLDSVTVTVRAPETAQSSSGTTSQGGQTDTQGRFQEETQHSLNGGTPGNTLAQGGTQGSEFGQRLSDVSGRQDGSPGGGSFQNSPQNSSQGGRQGSQTPREPLHWMGTEPDAEAAPRWATSTSVAMRLDLRA